MQTILTDVGPAPARPPSWCLPDTVPEHWHTSSGNQIDPVTGWSRDFGPDVWIACEDRVVDGRVIRSAPRIFHADAPQHGITSLDARDLADALVAAAEVVTVFWLEEGADTASVAQTPRSPGAKPTPGGVR